MAYFLKKTNRNGRIYLSIYESYYSPDTKNTKHRSFKKIGFVDKLIADGINDPINYFKAEVNALNSERKLEKTKISSKQISDISPEIYLGYVVLSRVLNTLDIEEHFSLMSRNRKFQFNLYKLFEALVFARSVAPFSKWKTYQDIFPSMFPNYNFSYDQILDGLEFLGSEYEKFVEILTVATNDNYPLNTSFTYFDCTNFYFEIDRETTLQRKGPSKENRRDPIIGMGLLLDSNMIPIGMNIYPGNQSEKPVLRHVIKSLKERNNISGKTVRVADKGLNCAQNIIDALKNNDGYVFSKSVHQLKDNEEKWVLDDSGYETIYDKKGEAKYKIKSKKIKITYSYIDENGNKITKETVEKRICSYNFSLAKKKKMEIEKLRLKAQNLRHSEAKKDEYGESSKYVKFVDEAGNKSKVILNVEAIERDLSLAGYNMIVTSEVNLSNTQIYDAYHHLWAIEESFRILKSDLDARPVYLQKENSIKGHFLVCYSTILLSRILQYKVLENNFGSSKIYDFMHKFKVIKVSDVRYINTLTSSEFVTFVAKKLNMPITNYYLTKKQIESSLKWKAQQNPYDSLNKEICPTLTTRSGAFASGMVLVSNYKIDKNNIVPEDNLIRRLTPKEFFNL